MSTQPLDDETLERLAEKAGGRFETVDDDDDGYPSDGGMLFSNDISTYPSLTYPSLRRFAALLAEECAKVCEELGERYKTPAAREVSEECAQDIREKFKP